jgi:hypothetical protein
MSIKSRTLSPEVLARRIDPRAAAALLDAIGRNDLAQLATLLDAGANPGSRSGTSPALHVAAQLGHAAIVARLLDAGADIDAIAHTDELIDRERVAGSETALMCSLRADREDVACCCSSAARVSTTATPSEAPTRCCSRQRTASSASWNASSSAVRHPKPDCSTRRARSTSP